MWHCAVLSFCLTSHLRDEKLCLNLSSRIALHSMNRTVCAQTHWFTVKWLQEMWDSDDAIPHSSPSSFHWKERRGKSGIEARKLGPRYKLLNKYRKGHRGCRKSNNEGRTIGARAKLQALRYFKWKGVVAATHRVLFVERSVKHDVSPASNQEVVCAYYQE